MFITMAIKMDKKGKEKCVCMYHHCSSGNAVYGFGFIGSAIYFISTAAGFWMGVLGIFKAMVWPVFLVYGLLKLVGM